MSGSRTVTIDCPVCGGEVEMSVWGEMYGADADGNRGVWTEEADVSTPCAKDCEWTDEQFEKAAQAAIEKNGADEESSYYEPDEEAA